MPPFPESIVRENTLCYDLSYSMNDTPFTAWAKNLGSLNVFQGWGMLIEQAALTEEVETALKSALDAFRTRLASK